MGRRPRVTRDQILAAARKAFAERGFAGTTLADVAKAIGVTPAAILRHFDTKQALFAAATSGHDIQLPPAVAELASVDADADPRVVLRHVAEQVVPFVQSVIGNAIAVKMHETAVVLPFDAASDDIPPRRALRLLTDYFARAMNATVIRPGDPRAMALMFMGQIQSYVFMHHVLNVTPVYPLHDYLDALIALWTHGAIEAGGTRARKTKAGREDHFRDRDSRRRDRGAALLPAAKKTEAARPRRNARGADGERGVARRRTRNPRSRR